MARGAVRHDAVQKSRYAPGVKADVQVPEAGRSVPALACRSMRWRM